MTRRLPLVVLVAAALLIPATATAKGPSDATISGPGLSSPLEFSGGGEGGNTALGELVSWGGFFAQTFGQEPDPLLRARPTVLLGPRYDVTYVVPGPSSTDTLRQELYPYAVGGPFTYMEPRQKFWGDQRTHGGWYRGNPDLRSALVEAGLPKQALAAHKRAAGSQRGTSGRTIAIGAGAGVVLAGAALLLLRRRR